MADRLRVDSKKYKLELEKISNTLMDEILPLVNAGELELVLDHLSDLRETIIELLEDSSKSSPMMDLTDVGKDKITELLEEDNISEIMELFTSEPEESAIFVLDE
jgi:hypothetical protein